MNVDRSGVLACGVAVLCSCALMAAQRSAVGGAAAAARPAVQEATGRLTGTITDTTGAALPGVTLIVTGPSIAGQRTAVTNAEGRFEFADLPAGRVDVTCNAPGFVQWRREGVAVAGGGTATLDVAMRRTPAGRGRGGLSGPGVILPSPGSRTGSPIEGVPRSGPAPDSSTSAPPPPEPTPAPPPTADREHALLEEISSFLAQLDLGSIAFNAPGQMRLGDTVEIRLLLSPTRSVEDLQRQLEGLPGVPAGAQVRIAPRMEAVLTGQDFRITAITPETQAVTLGEDTEWRWDVSPTAAGARRLHLALNATVLGSERTLRTFDQTIVVEVTFTERALSFVGNNWQWLLSTAVIPLAGWLWTTRRRSRQPR